jgi:electron transport complex protein RnfD
VPKLLIVDENGGKSIKDTLKTLANPMFVAMLVGMLIGITGIKLPNFVMKAVGSMGSCMSPVAMLLSLAILSYAFPVTGARLDFLVAQMFTGGVFFTAVFLLPYFPTAPATRNAGIVYGVLVGVLTYVFRRFYTAFDGVYLALLISSLVIAVLDPLLTPQVILWKKDF